MKVRGLIVATAVLAALSGALYWSNHRKPADDTAKASADAPPKILMLNESDITALALRKKGQPAVELSKKNSEWQITAPKGLAVDSFAVSNLLSTVSSLSSDRLIDEKTSDLAQYGLAEPALEVDITAKDKTHKLLLGEPTISGSGTFAALSGDPRVFTIAGYIKSSLDKGVDDLRDKRLLTADFDKVAQIELTTHKDKRTQDITFARDKDSWQIVKPKPYRADSSQVDQLISALRDYKLEASGDEQKTAAAFRSALPFASVKITGSSGTQELQVRKAKDDYYAQSSAVAGIYKMASSPSPGLALEKSLDDFRNKKLFDFGFSDPDKIEIHDAGKSFFFTHSGSDWWGTDGKKLDSDTVDSLLQKLRELTAAKFSESAFPAPTFELTAVSNSGKRTEKVAIAKSGDSCVAKRENEPALYELSPASVSELQQAAAGVKTAPPPAPVEAPKKK
jgi:uncharacterized protein DUF4340